MMRKLLTIGETAKMLKMSTSQIRFYEKEGLVTPHQVGENRYRLYDFKEADALEFVTLLRDLDMPLSEIRKIMNDQAPYDLEEILGVSMHALSVEIEELKKKYEKMEKKLEQYRRYRHLKDVTEVVTLPERILVVHEEITQNYMPIKEYFEFMQRHGLDHLDYDQELIRVHTPNGQKLSCTYDRRGGQEPPGLKRYVIPAGRFLSHRVTIPIRKDGFLEFESLLAVARERGLNLVGEQLAILDLNTLIYSKNEKYLTYQMRIQD